MTNRKRSASRWSEWKDGRDGELWHGWWYRGKRFVLCWNKGHKREGRAEKQEFRDALERMMGLVELDVMLCIAGDFNAHVGIAEPGEE